MRQTLVRILLDELWAVRHLNGTDYIGVGWMLVPWALYGLWILFQATRHGGSIKTAARSLAIGWSAVAVGILLLPTLGAGRFAPDGVPIRGYGFMLFVGFMAGAWWAVRHAKRVGVNGELIWDLGMWSFFLGIVGARLFYLIQYHQRVFGGLNLREALVAAINLPDGGLVLYGGMLLGIAGFFVFCKIKRVNPLLMADIVVPSLFLGIAFGRIGCLLNGCCYGDRCDLPWAIRFPAGSVPWEALLARGFLAPNAATTPWLHPTQLYSTLDALVLAFLTASYFKTRPQNGAVLAVGWLTYPVTRFLIEYLRGDELGKFHTSLTISQWVSIGLFVSGLVYTAWLVRRPMAGRVDVKVRTASTIA